MDASEQLIRVRAAFMRVSRVRLVLAGLVTLVILMLAFIWTFFVSAPREFPTDRLVLIPEDASVATIATALEADGVIRSADAFRMWMRVTGADREVHAGTYYFAKPITLFGVAERIATGERGIESIRVTLTEGMTAREMGEALSRVLPDFSAAAFTELAKPYEGYLFPDTYFIDPGTTPEQVVSRLRETFASRTDSLRTEAGERFDDIVVMASLIEKEADTAEDRRIVSGILWNRIDAEMPLQVDAVFGYILDRSGYAPTGTDLEIDSPYNTYENRGLPPGPISNPGLDALEAAMHPAATDYFYYLTGRDGLMYYAETFEEHKRNRELYLD